MLQTLGRTLVFGLLFICAMVIPAGIAMKHLDKVPGGSWATGLVQRVQPLFGIDGANRDFAAAMVGAALGIGLFFIAVRVYAALGGDISMP